jgi:hypothetical protein
MAVTVEDRKLYLQQWPPISEDAAVALHFLAEKAYEKENYLSDCAGYIRRKLQCGDNHAAAIMEFLEQRGDIGVAGPLVRLSPATTHSRAALNLNQTSLVGVVSARPTEGYKTQPGKWSGQLYNVENGQTYVGHLLELDGRTIRVEGCAIGICGGQNMTRLK